MSQNKNDAPVRLTILVNDPAHLRDLCGPHHSHLALIENAFGVRAESQGGGVEVQGESGAAALAEMALQNLVDRLERGEAVGAAEVRTEISRAAKGGGKPARILLPGRRGIVDARPGAQAEYLDALLNEETPLVFGVGPAGTGKTFLAVAAGTTALLEGRVSRLVVARPAVEAGERLGFLPGDLNEKVDPYLMPIWDALRGLLGAQQLERRRGAGEIEVAPLAFMRGRTLADAFVIVDEAQNATIMQMKMVLTRLGEGARMAVTGDPSQVDLPPSQPSGLAHALKILDGVKGVKITHFTADDVMRHALVSRIVRAYEKDAAANSKRKPRESE